MLVWIDLETQGLDEQVHQILEVALVVTDDDLNEVSMFTTLVQEYDGLERDQLETVVNEMHTKNGLYEALDNLNVGPTREQVEQRLIGVLMAAGAEKCVLAGSTISFDRAFLKRWMPDFHELLHYRNVDVSTINELARRWRPEVYEGRPQGDKAHRALADVRVSIETLRYYRRAGVVG